MPTHSPARVVKMTRQCDNPTTVKRDNGMNTISARKAHPGEETGAQPHTTTDRASHPFRVTVLGATGSIGTNTLDLIARDPERFQVEALSAGTNVEQLAECAKIHRAKVAVIADETRYEELKNALSGTGIEAAAGERALEDAARRPVDCVVAAIVGAAGLKPAFASLSQGSRLGLANKECLVCAGDVFMSEAKKNAAQIIPVDSEHSAAFQALSGSDPDAIEKITLTASGGPFREWTQKQIEAATPAQALAHPNWSMGPKVTIDSATMMNKGLELIEAFHLFPVTVDQLDAMIHPQSIVHCLVSFTDGSVLAQLSDPDMRTPISLALAWPQRMKTPTKRLDLAAIARLTFEKTDETRFPALSVARTALNEGGSAPAVLNAANEIAVAAFLEGRIGFTQITQIVRSALEDGASKGLIGPIASLSDVLEVDSQARALAQTKIPPMC